MQATTQGQREAVSSHVADSESIEAGRAGSEEVFVVTDSRVLSMTDTEKDGRSVRNIRSTNLTEGVRGLEIEEIESMPMITHDLLGGGFFTVVGVLSIFYGFTNLGSDTAIITVILGVAGILLGAFLAYDALDTPEGEIRVDITTDAGTDTYWLREDESEIAAAVSEIVGKNGRA